MKELVFDNGLVSFSINGAFEVSFNPTDSEFVEKLFNAFDTLDKKQDAYKSEVEKIADKRQVFQIARQRDKEMREIIDNVFEAPVSEAVFGTMNVYALASGLPVWCNLMLAVMDEVDSTFARERRCTDARIKKYTEKYHGK